MRPSLYSIGFMVALAAAGGSQTFEVATIKVNDLARQGGEGSRRVDIQAVPGSVTMRNAGMMQAIIWSFKVSPWQIGNPPGGDSDRYDIIAKAAGPAKVDEMRVMMQALLVERFKLVLHRETKELAAFALVEAKGGHKLKQSEEADGPGVLPVQGQGRMALGGRSATLDQLAMFLSDPVRRPVIDMTGLQGRYDFTFDITEFMPKGPKQPGEPEFDPVSVLQTALPKQLGLKLEARKLPVEMLIIDHIEKKPVEN